MPNFARLLLLLSMIAVTLTGCRGCLRENLIYEHRFNRPDCGSKPCPVECAEFDLPPGGPYVLGPGAGAGGGHGMTVRSTTTEK